MMAMMILEERIAIMRVFLCLSLMLCPLSLLADAKPLTHPSPGISHDKVHQVNRLGYRNYDEDPLPLSDNSSSPLDAPTKGTILNFQVSHPVLVPPASDKAGSDCVITKVLMDYVFTNSYYRPFVGSYKPPSCRFNRVTLNFTLHTYGVQYDRLGLFFLSDTEIFRTSTAEPAGNEIAYTYIKEVDHFLPLWKSSQRVIFDMPNTVDKTYTGPLYATLSATFFNVPDSDSRPIADRIYPITNQKSSDSKSSAFDLPNQKGAVSHKLPPNVKRAVVTLMANGQQREEYWYRNSFTSDNDKGYFPSAIRATQPYSPFREVQLLIDGQLAGVVWPFPNMFTGGINPSFWRPMVGIDAFDLRQHEIDITPWLGLLNDGQYHEFRIRIAGLADDGDGHATLKDDVGWYWVATGSIFLFLDPSASSSSASTYLSKPLIETPDPTISISSTPHFSPDDKDTISTLTWQTNVTRSLKITASLRSDPSKTVSWSQDLTYTNQNTLSHAANSQNISQSTTGLDVSLPQAYTHAYSYPFSISWSMDRSPSSLNLTGSFSQAQTHNIAGPSVLPNGIQPAMFANTSNTCPLSTNLTSPSPNNIPASFLHTSHKGKATYKEDDSGESPLLDRNSLAQSYTFNGRCIPASTAPSSLTAGPPTADNADDELETYTRAITIINEKITKDDQSLSLAGGKRVDIPDFGDILQWHPPSSPPPPITTLSSSDSNNGSTSSSNNIDASVQAILGIGDVDNALQGYQSLPDFGREGAAPPPPRQAGKGGSGSGNGNSSMHSVAPGESHPGASSSSSPSVGGGLKEITVA